MLAVPITTGHGRERRRERGREQQQPLPASSSNDQRRIAYLTGRRRTSTRTYGGTHFPDNKPGAAHAVEMTADSGHDSPLN